MRILNKRANLKYTILETLEAGIVLSGAEVKSVREGKVDLNESFAKLQNGEVFLKNAYFYPPKGADLKDYDPRHDRKLLLHRKEIITLVGKTSGKSITLIPLSLYDKRNFIKVSLGIAASKKKYDHRKAIKQRDEQRKLERELEI